MYRFIKICGLTNSEDARAAVLMGADILGMVMHPQSPRFCKQEQVLEISRNYYFKVRVLVFADNPVSYAENLLNHLDDKFTLFQIPLETELFGWANGKFHPEKIIPVISVGIESDIQVRHKLKNFPWVIFDTGGVKNEAGEFLYGGTGQVFDWNILQNIHRKYFLAGGLNPENIYTAISAANAPGFDVSSGIEKYAGKKDYTKMKLFIDTVRKT
ncbi:MAG: phosphoribosylanthranilate isomerase [Spirochaetia bacterium]|nr:phosphoribosylanthranilate isomerase [Spirochaetia bacterium]